MQTADPTPKGSDIGWGAWVLYQNVLGHSHQDLINAGTTQQAVESARMLITLDNTTPKTMVMKSRFMFLHSPLTAGHLRPITTLKLSFEFEEGWGTKY